MLEAATLVTFAAMLVTGIVYGFPLLVALIAGWLLFFDYGLMRGFDVHELCRMSTRGLSDVMPVLCLFVLIGALTASWRAAGTIPAIICWSVRVVSPTTLVPTSFLLCCVMSLLTGSSFASAATTGVICMAIASSMGANPVLTGGAIVSGCFFGDQCSPMSSSASLVAGITNTNLLSNVSRMMRTGAVPFVCCLGLYALFGTLAAPGADASASIALSGTEALRSFVLEPVVFVPVVLVFLLSKPISAYQLGEAYAQSMGVNIKRFRVELILLSSVLSATVTAYAGPISFVGIAVPFLMKHALGTAKPIVVIPATFLGGSVFCMVCDLIARMAFAPTELNISTITAVFGAPVVIFMMISRRTRKR